MNMQENNEFPEIGKKTHFKVPVGFFETVSDNTLLKAKQRALSRRKRLVLWRTVTVAASLAALLFLGYNISDSGIKKESTLIVSDNQPVEQNTILQKPEPVIAMEIAEISKTDPEKVPEKIMSEVTDTEVIGDVLADLTDDELLQLAAMYKSDPFISESDQ